MNVVDELQKLEMSSRCQLIEAWSEQFGHRPAKNLSSAMMRRILSYELQCKMRGGLSPAAKRALGIKRQKGRRALSSNTDASIDVSPKPSMLTKTAPLLSAGTNLVREWNGRTYRVEVTDNGFEMDGKNYGSLTAIAKRITGAHWSGARFFGLKAA